jgi:hypothetical protein
LLGTDKKRGGKIVDPGGGAGTYATLANENDADG